MRNAWYIDQAIKGNISLIMLFILGIGSLIGLMSTWFIQDMISSSSQIRDFYQSYYIAKWWLELWTLAVNRYEYGFEDHLSGTQSIIANNLNCKKNCNLDLTIQSRITTQNSVTINSNLEIQESNSCSTLTEDRFMLSPWESYVLPLFADERKLTSNNNNNISNVFNSSPQYNINITSNSHENSTIGIGVVLWSWNQSIYNMLETSLQQKLFLTWSLINNLNIFNFLNVGRGINSELAFWWQSINSQYTTPPNPNNDDYFNYLYITNISWSPFEYCLRINNSQYGFISDKSIINAVSTYGETTLWLQAQARKPLLEYIVRSNTEYDL